MEIEIVENFTNHFQELGPKLLGQDPTQLSVLNSLMDYNLKGHPYVKSAIDMACWDILGKATGLSVNTLLGGNFNPDGIPLYRAIGQASPAKMAEQVEFYVGQGYQRFQLKLGGDPAEDIERIRACRETLSLPGQVLIGDSNTGWTTAGALRVAAAVKELDVYMEQPCPSYRECLTVRQHTDLPFVLDEVVDDVQSLLDVYRDGSADVVNVKISKFGGLTKARQGLELCSKLGISVTVEDTWGGDINTAAILHLAHTVPPKLLLTVTDFNSYNTVHTGTISGAVKDQTKGRMTLPTGPGLGVTPDFEVLGQPLFVIQ